MLLWMGNHLKNSSLEIWQIFSKILFYIQNPASFNQICKILCVSLVIFVFLNNNQSTSIYFNPFVRLSWHMSVMVVGWFHCNSFICDQFVPQEDLNNK